VTVPQSTSIPRVSTFLNKLQYSIKNIPESVPEAGDNDKLAIFGGDPKGFDDESLDQGGPKNRNIYPGSNFFLRPPWPDLTTYVIRHMSIYGNMT